MFVHNGFAEPETAGLVRLVSQEALPNPVREQFTGPRLGGPCPDWREFIAADTSWFTPGLWVDGAVFVADEFVDGTTGAIRAAIDRRAKNRAVSEVLCRSLRETTVSTCRSAP